MKILMVCLGNICRSPLAEGIMRHLVAARGLNWEIASAGTGNWHVGQAPDKRSIAVARLHGYDIRKQRAKHFKENMFAYYDLIFVMDKNNLRDVFALANNQAARDKVHLFLEDGEVPDPYYDNNAFEPVCKQIEQRCKEIIEEYA